MATKTANVKARVPFSLDIPDKLATRDSITQGLDEATGEKEYTMLWKRK